MARLTWNGQGLRAMVTTTTKQIAVTTRPDEPVFHDNAVELFFDPLRDGREYTEIQINAAGRIALLRLDKPYHLGGTYTRLDPTPIRNSVKQSHPLNTPTSEPVRWSVLMDIPWHLLTVAPPRPGEIWRLNIAMVEWEYELSDGRSRRKPDSRPRFLASHPTGLNDLHRLERWGELVFR